MTRHVGARALSELAASISTGDQVRRRLLLSMVAAALEAVDPEEATRRALIGEGSGDRPVTIVAIGKAAPAMARGAGAALGEQVAGGLVVSTHSAPVPPGLDLVVGAHPVPDAASLDAGRRALRLVSGLSADDQVLFLISGGGSAAAEVPADGLGLDDLITTYEVLFRAGLDIEETNTIRTHLSDLKGGRLAAATPAATLSILISDVPGSDPSLIASGPTVAPRTSPSDALAIVEGKGLRLPRPVVEYLKAAPPPPSVDSRYVVAADGQAAARAAASEALSQGVTAVVSDRRLTGSADKAAADVVAGSDPSVVSLFTGETTVEVTGHGRGGRNQEGALAASLLLEGTQTAFLSFGTDGIDGPTDAAGAMVDGTTAARLRAAGVDPVAALDDNDSHPALDAVGALIRCGPTGTNVADLWLVDRH